jgi:hypothetical protein
MARLVGSERSLQQFDMKQPIPLSDGSEALVEFRRHTCGKLDRAAGPAGAAPVTAAPLFGGRWG